MAKHLVVFLACLVVQFAFTESFFFRWCTINTSEKSKCDEFVKLVEERAANMSMNVTAQCVLAGSVEDCMAKIKNDTADLVTLDGGKVYKAGKNYGLVPIMAEVYGEYGPKYYAVAVVKKNNTGFKLDESLKGRKSCHTGARRTAGWNVPIGYLLRQKVIPNKDCDSDYNDLISVGSFFRESCAPGSNSHDYNKTGVVPSSLCSLCAGSGSDKCSTNPSQNKYASYHGAFKCMADGKGDVAFVKHTTVSEVVEGGGYGSLSDYEYLCKDGTRKDIGKHLGCNLGSNPAHAVVTRSGNNIENIVKILKAMSDMYGGNQTNVGNFQLFNSTKYGGANLLFKDSATSLKEVEKKTYGGFLGDYEQDLEAVFSCVVSTTTKPGDQPTPTSDGYMKVPSVAAFMASLLTFLVF